MKNLKRVILLIETSRAFGRELLAGIARYSRLHGPWSFYREPRGLKTHIPHIENWDADGIIMRNTSISNSLIDMQLPVVSVLHYQKKESNIPIVVTSANEISQLAAQHLLNRGFTNFAFCGFNDFDWSNERCINFVSQIEKGGFQINVYKQPSSKKYKSWKNEQQYMAEWLNKLPKPIGIMACNDDRGQHVLEACKIAELTVPEEVAVIGVDNDTLICDLCDPPLSSIALNIEEAGYKTAELLDQLMNGEKMNRQVIPVLPTHIVRRHSTDILAIQDKNLVLALTFIRENARQKILVNQVVKSTALSRRSLEKRFNKTLGRTIMGEVRRIRIDLICKMLTETDMSISEITATFNFADIEHISRYFKKEKGLSLREFRCLHK